MAEEQNGQSNMLEARVLWESLHLNPNQGPGLSLALSCKEGWEQLKGS